MFIRLSVPAACAEDNDTARDAAELFRHIQVFANSIALIKADYAEPVDTKELVYGAVRGMTDTLDGYSQFLDPKSYEDLTEMAKGEFAGVGIEIGIQDNILTVITPIDDTPAFEAGILAGDKIVKIDAETTRDMTLDDAVLRLRGEPATEVGMTVVREEVDEPLDFKITRAVIKLKSIKEAKLLAGDIGYIKVTQFQKRTSADLKKTLEELMRQGAKSLILDLRNNSGGLFEAAVETADYFLKPGMMIVYTEGRAAGTCVEFKAKRNMEFTDLDMVILVNKGSASASEILAGAIKDNKRGRIVGVTTFGKGSVQTVIPFGDGSALKLTTAAYFTPAGTNLMDKGIEPDVYVEREKPIDNANDNQLKAAIDALRELEAFKKNSDQKKPAMREKGRRP